MLGVHGFTVHDLGRDVPTPKFIDKAKETGAQIIGTSALLTTTMTKQKELEEALKEAGLKGQVKTMVGGAPVTQRWADRIGADGYAENAHEAVSKATSWSASEGSRAAGPDAYPLVSCPTRAVERVGGRRGGAAGRVRGHPRARPGLPGLESRLVAARAAELRGFPGLRARAAPVPARAAPADTLARAGFARVVTPTILSRGLLARMAIRPRGTRCTTRCSGWTSGAACAPCWPPTSTTLLTDLLRIWDHPVRIFEVGSCFRRDSQGARHAGGVHHAQPGARWACRPRAAAPGWTSWPVWLMEAAGIREYAPADARTRRCTGRRSTWFATAPRRPGAGLRRHGPAPAGPALEDHRPWVGIGFGLERLVMAAEGGVHLAPLGEEPGAPGRPRVSTSVSDAPDGGAESVPTTCGAKRCSGCWRRPPRARRCRRPPWPAGWSCGTKGRGSRVRRGTRDAPPALRRPGLPLRLPLHQHLLPQRLHVLLVPALQSGLPPLPQGRAWKRWRPPSGWRGPACTCWT